MPGGVGAVPGAGTWVQSCVVRVVMSKAADCHELLC